MINIININAFYHRLKDKIIEILPTKIVFLNSNPKKIQMKIVKILTAILLIIVTNPAFCQDTSKRQHTLSNINKGNNKYCCPMHTAIKSDQPGNCPKCKMKLIQSKKEIMKSEVMKIYQCPMHPNEKSNQPGKCKLCKMEMKEKIG